MHRKKPYNLLITVFLLNFLIVITASVCHSSTKIKPKRAILKNGITLLVVEAHSLPIVNVSVAVKTGAIYDPEGKSGVANLTGILLDEGTKTRTSKQIAEEIDFIGGRLSTSGGTDYSSASLVVMKKDLNKGMELFSDVLLNPIFPEEEVERKKKEILASIISDKDDPGVIASKAFYKSVFKGHPYSMPEEGDEESIKNISREDVVGFYNKYYKPDNTIMVVTGDVNFREIKTLIEASFKTWRKSKINFPEIVPVEKLQKKESILIDKNISQANIMLGHTGISRDNPDFYAVYLMNYIMGGGGFSSRMTKEIRDNRGLAYSVHSAFDINKYTGAFVVELQTKNETATEAVERILDELKKIREEHVTDVELDEAKAYLTGSFPLKLDTNAKIGNFLMFIEFYNLGLDYFDTYPEKIQAVTKDDILRAAKKYIDPDHYILVAVANQKEAGMNKGK